MSNFETDTIVWNDAAPSTFQSKWRNLLGEVGRERELFTADTIGAHMTYDYKKHPDSKDHSLLRWAVESKASVVITVNDENQTSPLLGWAVKANDSTGRETIELFVTEDKDILNTGVKELSTLSKYVAKSSYLQGCVNRISADRPVVAMFFADFYANVILIAVYIKFTQQWLFLSQGPTDASIGALYFISIYFLLREAVQVASQRWQYFMDAWNIVDISRFALVVASAYYSQPGRGDHHKIDILYMWTMGVVIGGMISFLRSTFKPFSGFVSALLYILVAMVPFLVIAFLVLLAFGYMYWVGRFACDLGINCRLIDGFYTAYSFFVSGPEDIRDFLDIMTGLVLAIVLLNVLIAIVTDAYQRKTASDERFWKYRLAFLIELRSVDMYFRKEAEPNSLMKHSRYNSLDNRITRLYDRWGEADDFGTRAEASVGLVFYSLIYGLRIALGLLTFGILWPRGIRDIVFGRNEADEKSNLREQVEELKNEIHKMQELTPKKATLIGGEVSATEELRSEIQDLKKSVDEIRDIVKTLPALVGKAKGKRHKGKSNTNSTEDVEISLPQSSSRVSGNRMPSAGGLVAPELPALGEDVDVIY